MSRPKHRDHEISVEVYGNNVEQAVRVLRKKCQTAGLFHEMRSRKHFISNGERRGIAIRRSKQRAKRKAEREAIERKRYRKYGPQAMWPK